MTWKVEVATNAAATTWDDVTAAIDRTTAAFGGHADDFEVGQGSGFDLADDAAAKSLPSRRVVRVIEDATVPDTTMFRGRIVSVGLGRGTRFDGDARQFDVVLADYNQDLQGIAVDKWSRASETDYTRFLALRNQVLDGSYRASTNLALTYVPNTNTVTMAKKVYERTDPAGVAADCIDQSGKTGFVTVDGELFYDRRTSLAYAAGLGITDVAPDSAATFAPIWAGQAGERDGSELFTGAILVKTDGGRLAMLRRSAVEDAHDVWTTTISDDDITKTTAAQARTSYLDEHAKEDVRYRCAIRLHETQVHLIKWGQTVNFRAAAAGVLAPIGVRIVRLMWRPVEPGWWEADLELDYPMKANPKRPRGSVIPMPPQPTPASVLTPGSLALEPFDEAVRPVPIVAATPTLPDNLYPPGATVSLTADGKIYRNVAGVWTREVDGADLAAGSLGITPFASTIRPVVIVGALPGLPDATYPVGSTVVLTTNGKLYRNVAGAWTAVVAGSDIVDLSIGGGNMVRNASFEMGFTDWINSGAFIDSGRAAGFQFDGVQSLRFTTGGYQYARSAPMDFQAGVTYTASFWISSKGTGATSSAGAGIVFEGVDGNPGKLIIGAIPSAWTRYSVTWTQAVTQTAQQMLVTGSYGGTHTGEIFIDAVQVEAGAHPTAFAPHPYDLLEGSITTAKLADLAVTLAKVNAGAIDATKITDDAVTTPKIAANAVVAAKIGAGEVTAVKLAAGSVETDKLAANAVVAGKIAAGAIETDKLAANAVTADKIAAGTITAAEIAADTITAAKIAAGAIGVSELAANAVTADKIQVGGLGGGNMLPNAAFQSGFAGFDIGPGPPVVDARTSPAGFHFYGKQSLAFYNHGTAEYLSVHPVGGFTFIDGVTYTISFWITDKSTGATSTAGMGVVGGEGLNTPISGSPNLLLSAVTGQWKRYSTTWVQNGTQTGRYILLTPSYGGTYTGEIFFAAVQVEVGAIPSAFDLAPSDLRNSTAEVVIDSVGVTVINGKITVANAGAVVIIDGTSNMFKISGTGTLTQAFPAAGNYSSTGANVTAAGGASVACIFMVTINNADAQQNRLSGVNHGLLAAGGHISYEAFGFTLVSAGGTTQVWLAAHSVVADPGTTAALRWYTLKEAGI